VLNAEFDNVNFIDSSTESVTIVTDQTGGTLTVASQDLSAAGLGIADISVSSSTAAAEAVSALDSAIVVASARVGAISEANGKVREEGDQQDKLIRLANPNVTSQISTELTEQEAALLAGEVRDTLGVKRLAIANVQSQSLLALIQG
jgi:flagellin